MMEDPLIEKNNDLNDIFADDGGSSDLDEIEDEGSDAFTTTLAQNKPHDEHPNLRQRRRTNVSYSEETHIQIDDHRRRDNKKLMHLTRRPPPTFHLLCNFLKYILLGGPTVDQVSLTVKKTEPHLLYKPRDDPFGLRWRRINLSSLGETQINLSSWVRDVVSKTISPRRTAIAAAGTHEQRSPGGNSNDERKGWSKTDFEWIFVIINIALESMSAIFTQLASKQKPQYALFGMLLSYLALLTCMIELIYEGRRHRQQIPIGRTKSGTLCYYDRPQRRKSLATLNKIVALACALGQCVVTTINYRFQNPIKLTISPIILAFGVLFSKILKYHQRESTLISFMKSL
ncbi:hypothetical protein Q3G72_004083 [Acer saccharum]|nr:hypothetical protein Q3G72_004083 [Acer saccharum]